MFTTYINIGDISLFTKVFKSRFEDKQLIDPKQKTLILLHGGPGMDHTHYLKTWAKHIDNCQLIMFDQRGNGRSSYGESEKWVLQQWAMDVYQFCEKIVFQQKPFLGGMSFGASVALKAAIDYPDLPAGLILSEVDARFNREQFLKNLAEKVKQDGGDVAKVQQLALDIFSNYNEQTSANYFTEVVPYYSSTMLNGNNDYADMIFNLACSKKYLEGEFQTMDFRSDLKKIKCPVLLMTGDQNPFHSLENAQEVAAEIRQDLIELHIFHGAGSELHNHVPEKMMPLIKNFINKHT